MAKMITRTFATHTIHALGIKTEDPSTQIEVEPLVVNDPTMDAAKAVMLLMKRDKSMMYIVTSIETNAKIMGMTEEDFLAHAVEVTR